jgi:hypothetical protein
MALVPSLLRFAVAKGVPAGVLAFSALEVVVVAEFSGVSELPDVDEFRELDDVEADPLPLDPGLPSLPEAVWPGGLPLVGPLCPPPVAATAMPVISASATTPPPTRAHTRRWPLRVASELTNVLSALTRIALPALN